jgi:DNA-binding response OmpR family regulator
MNKVLVVEDEASIRRLEVINLKRSGYNVFEAESGETALEILHRNRDVRLVILDVMLPGIDGFETCRRVRAMNAAIGVIMVTARTQEVDKITGLMNGADDYITKPFSTTEFIARVDALMRRIGAEELPTRDGPFSIDGRSHTLFKNGQQVKLTQVEFAIMELFMKNPGRAMSREDILTGVWGRDFLGELKIVDVNIRRLRLKIEDDAQSPKYITTVWGLGYKYGN